MTDSPSQTDAALPDELPHHQTFLDETDWASLATPCGTGENLPAALARLLDPDPGIRAVAVVDALGAVTHQNSIYEATVPVALYVAAILSGKPRSRPSLTDAPRSRLPSPRSYWLTHAKATGRAQQTACCGRRSTQLYRLCSEQ